MLRSAPASGTARGSRRDVGGDDAAFERLYCELKPRVRGLVRRLVRDRELVEDIVQETFLRAFRSGLHLQDGSEEEWPWLATVARNLCLDVLRRRQRIVETPVEEPDEYRTSDEESSGELDRMSDAEGIDATLQAVTDRERRILLHHHVKGHPYRQIAAAEGLSLDALKSAMARARRRFRAEFLARAVGDEEVPDTEDEEPESCRAA